MFWILWGLTRWLPRRQAQRHLRNPGLTRLPQRCVDRTQLANLPFSCVALWDLGPQWMAKGPGGLTSVQTAVWEGDLLFSVNYLRNKGISGRF